MNLPRAFVRPSKRIVKRFSFCSRSFTSNQGPYRGVVHNINTSRLSNEQNKKSTNKYAPVVICGPSGSGKGTLVQSILKDENLSLHFSLLVSHTTRSPRQGEIDNIHYKFISVDEFESGIKNNSYIEYNKVHGSNYYGTHRDSILQVSNDNKICIVEIDVIGAQVIKNDKDIICNYLFVNIPGSNLTNKLNQLEKRLISRGSETEETIKTRLSTAEKELKFFDDNPFFFHEELMNDDREMAEQNLKYILKNWYPWLTINV